MLLSEFGPALNANDRSGRGDRIHREAEREHVGGDRRAHADEADRAARSQEREELGEIHGLLRRERHEYEVQRAGDRVELGLVGVRHEVMRAQSLGLLRLGSRARKSGDLGSERSQTIPNDP